MLEKDLVLRNVSKRYGDKLVVDGVDLTINKGDFLTILGPSGGGKTTVLKMISGFESISSGDIFLDGKTIGSIPAHKKKFWNAISELCIISSYDSGRKCCLSAKNKTHA